MPSSQSFSRIHCRMRDSPEPAAGEQRRTVEHDRDAAAALAVRVDRAHLRQHVLQEQQRPVVDAWQPGTEPPAEPQRLVLGLDLLLHFLPLHPERRVGQHVVERPALVAVVAERVAEHHVLRNLPLDHQVGPADRPRLRVQLLPVHLNRGVRVERGDVLLGGGQHPAGAAGRVEHRAHHARHAQRVGVRRHQQVDHQLDHLTRREVFPSGLVRHLREPADQLLEHVAHLVVADHLRAQVQVGEPAHHLVEKVRGVEPLDVRRQVVRLKHLARVVGEGPDVRGQVCRRVGRVVRDRLQRQLAGVVKPLAGRAAQERVDVNAPAGVLVHRRQHLLLGGGEHAFQPAQHRERQDHLAVVGLLVVAAQQVRHGPSKVGQLSVLAVVHRHPFSAPRCASVRATIVRKRARNRNDDSPTACPSLGR